LESGIEQYPVPAAEATAAGIARHLGFKLSEVTDAQRNLVHTFTDEEAFLARGTPALVKFYQPSCPHCVHYVRTFQRGEPWLRLVRGGRLGGPGPAPALPLP
jgi:hypothetical protein